MCRVALALVCLLAACGDQTTTARFAIPGVAAVEDFYDLPFPNDLRRTATGLDLALFPTNSLIVDSFRVAAESLDGFALNAAMFARFDGPIDPASLPDAAGSVAADAAVYVVNVDPASPDRGARTPIAVRFRAAGYQTLGGDNLVVRPYPGFPLDEGTTYALVMTRRMRDLDGDPVATAPQLRELFAAEGGPAAVVAAREVYRPLLELLDEPGEDEREDVVSAAVFTTQRATRVAPALRAAVYALPAPVAAGVTRTLDNPTYSAFIGTYVAPNFQAGDVPYRLAPSGQISVDATGVAVVQRMEPMRFAVSVPAGPVPATGWPLVIYGHGTNGDFATFLGDNTANILAQQGLAVISTDQVLHGPRSTGGNPEFDFFNFGNPYAARDNALQGCADAFSQLRLGLGLSIDDAPRTHVFDPARIYYFGHSQGGTTGPPFIAYEPSLSGAVLSGTAGLLYENLLHKLEPYNIPEYVETFARDEPIDEDNPTVALVQLWIERSDPINYAPLMVRRPPTAADGMPLRPRNIFQTEGFVDTYSPNIGIEAFATALGGDLVQLPTQREVPGLTLRGRTVRPAPITDNVAGVTAVLAQYDQRPGSDGHFVVFDIPAAAQQAAEFLGTLSRTGHATVVEVN